MSGDDASVDGVDDQDHGEGDFDDSRNLNSPNNHNKNNKNNNNNNNNNEEDADDEDVHIPAASAKNNGKRDDDDDEFEFAQYSKQQKANVTNNNNKSALSSSGPIANQHHDEAVDVDDSADESIASTVSSAATSPNTANNNTNNNNSSSNNSNNNNASSGKGAGRASNKSAPVHEDEEHDNDEHDQQHEHEQEQEHEQEHDNDHEHDDHHNEHEQEHEHDDEHDEREHEKAQMKQQQQERQQQMQAQQKGDGHTAGTADSAEEESEEEEETGGAPTQAKLYNPEDYRNLNVSSEIQDLFNYIGRYKPSEVELETKLKPFIPDYIPAVGDIDNFLKVAPPDDSTDGLGLVVLDEPASQQTDQTVLELKLRNIYKQTNMKPVNVRSIENADKHPRKIAKWIANIDEIHRSKAPPMVDYSVSMPEIEDLMQAWPNEFEALLQTMELPTADIDLDTEAFTRVICAFLDIPVYDGKVKESLHVLFTLYSEFRNNAHFQQS